MDNIVVAVLALMLGLFGGFIIGGVSEVSSQKATECESRKDWIYVQTYTGYKCIYIGKY